MRGVNYASAGAGVLFASGSDLVRCLINGLLYSLFFWLFF